MFVIEEELKKLPQKPGVYLMTTHRTISFMSARRFACAAEYSRISVRKLTADHRLKRW